MVQPCIQHCKQNGCLVAKDLKKHHQQAQHLERITLQASWFSSQQLTSHLVTSPRPFLPHAHRHLLCLTRTQSGQRQTVKNEEYYCHAHNRDGLVGIAFADGEYPARAGFGVVNKVLDEFCDQSGNKWRSATEDITEALPILEPALTKYQV